MENFLELNNEQMLDIDGGIDWNSIGMGTSMTAGWYLRVKIGSSIGLITGPGGTVAGALIGGAIGGIIYSLWD